MQVVLSAECENMEPHTVPLLAHHLGQVAVDHACEQEHMQPLSALQCSEMQVRGRVGTLCKCKSLHPAAVTSCLPAVIEGRSICKRHAHMHACMHLWALRERTIDGIVKVRFVI